MPVSQAEQVGIRPKTQFPVAPRKATVEKTAGGAKTADTMVAAAKADAEKGGQIVRAAIEAMAGIEQSSKLLKALVGREGLEPPTRPL